MKTILITGASSGFGKQTARLFHSKGWNVIATMRSPEKEMELSLLNNVLVTGLDVQNKDSIQQAVTTGIKAFGQIDVLLNNAGYAVMGIFEQANEAQIKNQFDVNVFGMMRVTQTVLPYMRTKRSGTIINISSVAGLVGLPFASIYESSKFAVEGFSESLHFELSPLDITVKVIEPGSSRTNFGNAKDTVAHPVDAYLPYLGNFYKNYPVKTGGLKTAAPEEVAATIYQAATDETNKLRYIIGEDCRFFAEIKQKNDEEGFLNTIKDFMK